MDVQAAIKSCHAERRYQRRDISDADLRKILGAGWQAPSSLDQRTKFIVVTDEKQREALRKVCLGKSPDTKHIVDTRVAVALVVLLRRPRVTTV